MKITVKGTDLLTKHLSKIKDLEFARKTVKKHGAKLQKAMKDNATPGKIFVKGYSTGETKRSIGLEIIDSGLTAVVAPNTEYAVYPEYGTRFMEAEPFVKPALDSVEKGFIEDLEKMDK